MSQLEEARRFHISLYAKETSGERNASGFSKMECGEACTEIGEAVEDVRMLTFEMEAAEALVGLARSSSLPSEVERWCCQPIVIEGMFVSSQPPQLQELLRIGITSNLNSMKSKMNGANLCTPMWVHDMIFGNFIL